MTPRISQSRGVGRVMCRSQGDGTNRGSMNWYGGDEDFKTEKNGSRGMERVMGRGQGDGPNWGR